MGVVVSNQLSNTATPIYYGRFRDSVLRGEIPVSQEITLEMMRIDRLIADPTVFYDPLAINGFIAFCEHELTLPDGDTFKLLESFKLWSEQIFAWYTFVEREFWDPGDAFTKPGYRIKTIKKRLVNKQYLIVARGSAKSMYASCIQSYFLHVDTETTHQITTAPTMRQAEEVMNPMRTSLTRPPGPYFQFLTQGSLQNTTGNKADRVKAAATKRGIENFVTGSFLEIRPLSINKLQGLRPKISTIDEWLSGDLREDVIGALEQGASKLDDWLIVAISSEGTVRNGSGDTVKMELADILKGATPYEATRHISIWHYKLDSIEEVEDPSKWVKANPNIGITVTYEVYEVDKIRAENAPAARNDILAKRFGLPMQGTTYFFTYEETIPLETSLSFQGGVCGMGVDLSMGDDFCAFTFMFPLRDGAFGIKARSYITERTLNMLPSALRFKYQEFMNENALIIMDRPILDMMEVFDDLEAHIRAMNYTINAVGYDPYGADEFINRWKTENGVWGVEKVPQGSRTESIPLGELKKMSEQGLLLFDEQIFGWCMGNAVVQEDTNGNRKLVKRRGEEKIDNVSALMDAWVAIKANKEAFVL